MSKHTQIQADSNEQYPMNLDLEALKFIYQSCVYSLLNMDFEQRNDPRSLVRLRTCITIFEQLEKCDPNWLIQNGFAYNKGFHASKMRWIQNLNH